MIPRQVKNQKAFFEDLDDAEIIKEFYQTGIKYPYIPKMNAKDEDMFNKIFSSKHTKNVK